jgi:predicted peptidase
MKPAIKILFFMLLIVVACEKEDQILPQLPAPEPHIANLDSTAAVFEPDSAAVDPDHYLYGEYKHMPYRFLIPRNYDSSQTYPVHVFLHGISERGTDNEGQLVVGGDNFLTDSIRSNYPAFIIFPQCPKSAYWFDEPVMDTLKGLLDAFVSDNPVDKQRISIGGFSMGAYGTFALVAKYPGFFEAAIAISGEGDEHKAAFMTKPKWQIFAGEKDSIVPSNKSGKIAKALKDAGATVSFTLFENGDHYNTWMKAFSRPDFFSRLFAKDR